MGVTDRQAEMLISARNEASAIFKQVAADGKAAGKDISDAFLDADGVIQQHTKSVNTMTQFYKTHRAEIREEQFYYKQSKDAISAVSFGLMALIGTTDDQDASQQKVNKALAEGLVTFQGMNFLLSTVPGGTAAAAILGVAAAAFKMSDDTAAAAANLKLLKQVADDFNKGINLKETQAEYDILTKNIEESNHRIDELNKASNNTAQARIVTMVNGIAVSTSANNKDIESINGQIVEETAHRTSMQLMADSLKNQIDLETQLAAVRQREAGGKFVAPDPEGLNFIINMQKNIWSLDDAAKAAGKDYHNMLGTPNKGFEEEERQYTEVINSITQMEKESYKKDYDFQVQLLDEWVAKVKATKGTTQKEIDRAEAAAHEKKKKLWLDEHQYITGPLMAGYKTLATEILQGTANIGDVWNAVKASGIDAIVTLGQKYIENALANLAVSETTSTASTAATVADMAIVAAAAEPAAIFTSIASFGAADAAALTGLSTVWTMAESLKLGSKFGMGTPPGDFTVPPGYPNDTYRVGLTTGEKVNVTPSSKSSAGNNAGQMVQVNLGTKMSKNEVVTLLREVVRDTGSSIDKLTRNNRNNLKLGS